MMKRIRIPILTALILFISCIGVTAVFAGTGGPASASVYVTISDDGDFVQGTDGTVMANVPFTVEYFDLADYGLEKYYRYDDDDNLIEKPTVLHLLIRVLERYYAMRTLDREGDMHSSIINVTGAAKSIWLDKFWGHNGNLMYHVNDEYPLMSEKWGATADYILLDNGDTIDLAMFTHWSGISSTGAFAFFENRQYDIKVGEDVILEGRSVGGMFSSTDVQRTVMNNIELRVSSDDGFTWSKAAAVTNKEGWAAFRFNEPGRYLVSAGPEYPEYEQEMDVDYRCVAPPIAVINVKGEEQPLANAKQTAINNLQDYKSSDLYRETEQASLASIIESGTAAIDAAETKEEVATLLALYIARIDELKTDAEYTQEEETARKEQEEAEQKAREAAIKKAKAAKTTIKVRALKRHKAKVTWKKVTLKYTVDGQKYSMPVSGYKIYRATKKNGKYKLVKTIKKAGTLKYIDKKLKKGKKYFYKVRPYTKIAGTAYLGKWSKARSVRAK